VKLTDSGGEKQNKSKKHQWEPIYYHSRHEVCNSAGRPQKSINFILKFYIYLPKENKERKTSKDVRETSLDLLSKLFCFS